MVAGAVAIAVGGGSVGAWFVEQRGDASGTSGTARAALQSEIDAMLDAGIPPGDQKLRMLENELAALQALEGTAPVAEPGIDLDVVARGGQRSAAPNQPDATEQWENGPVECEPIPQRLSAEDLVDATCFVEPRADGSVRYVAVAPDGTEREVLFE